jgi:O-antigen/teichoic acid export membrane protein
MAIRAASATGRSMSSRFLSIPYLALRSSTAGGALAAGLIQTFVFARVLDPERFSLFILVGTLGVSLWLFDLGLARILFVRQRDAFLAGRKDRAIAGHSTAVIGLYAVAVVSGTILCFAVMMMRGQSVLHAFEFALFFMFVSLNLVWFVVRFVSVAIDEFIFFETHEAIRRIGHIVLMLAMLANLPLTAFLVLANLLWAALLASGMLRLTRHRALAWPRGGIIGGFRSFFRRNKHEAIRTGAFAGAEFYSANFPYLVVPLAFGLGAPTIILDTTFKVFRGTMIIYAAGCDVMVPRQTRALAEKDQPALIKTTLTAVALCSVPAIVLCGLLIFAGERLFALLLGPAATMPPATTPILILLLLCNLAQTVSNSVLLHTGYFRQLAAIAAGFALAVTAMTAIVLTLRLDITEYLWGYAIAFAITVAFSVAAFVRGPIRAARG